MKNFQGRGLNLRGKKRAGVELAMKNWEGKKITLAPLFQFAPPTYWGHMPFLLSSWGHACCYYNESESYRPTITCRHCVDQQSDSLVFTEVHSDHRKWSHWKVGGQRPILAPLHRNLEGHSSSLPYNLFHPRKHVIGRFIEFGEFDELYVGRDGKC